MKTTTALVLLLAVAASLATAKKKVPHVWQTGFLVTSSYQIYEIEGPGYRFRAQYSVPLYGRDRRVPNVTVNGWVGYALDDGTFYVRDDGREFKTTLLEKRISNIVVTADQVREYAKSEGISEVEATRIYSRGGQLIAPAPAPTPPAEP